MRRSAAVIALVALAATAGGGSAQGDGAFVSPLARDIDASASASALGDVPPETDAWSNAGAYWESGGDTPRHGAEDRTDVSSSDVYDAVKALGAVPYRQCFVVVKDGAIAHESYDERRGVDASTRLATDSVGIIATVALVGAATQRGLFRLDQPVMSYGVRGVRERFGAYAGLVTAHHLLAQTHGGGEVPPGEIFRRDDDPAFLATLFELIETTAGTSVREFARVALVEPLGLSSGSVFGEPSSADGTTMATTKSSSSRTTDPDADSETSARLTTHALAYGRNFEMTCRDLASLAQLFLNGGVWRDASRVNRQIVSARFAREAFSPRAHFPRLNRAFGLGAWTHDPDAAAFERRGDSAVQCCAPVTGMRACGESAEPLLGPLLGARESGGPAERVGVFLGDEGSAVFVLPDTNVAVVSLGRTVAGSDACPVGLERATAGTGAGGSLGGAEAHGSRGSPGPRRDDYALLKVLWGAVRPATKAGGDGYAARAARAVSTRSAYSADSYSADVKADVSKRKTRHSEKTEKTKASSGSGSVRDLVTSAFRDSFRDALETSPAGTLGTLPGGESGETLPESVWKDPRASSTGPTGPTSGAGYAGYGSFASNSRAPFRGVASDASRVDAEVRRLTAARARWYADAEVRLTAEDRARRADYDKKIEALHETQAEYKAAYERAKLEIVAAAKEEKKAERRERDADAEKNAARWRASAAQTLMEQRQEQLDAREREVKRAQEEYADALAAARAAAADETEETTRVDTPDETRTGSRFFETTINRPTPFSRASAVSRSKDDASSSAKRPERKVSKGVSKGLEGLDEGLEGLDVTALDFKASGLLDDAGTLAGAASEKAPETLSATKRSDETLSLATKRSRRTSKRVVVRETRRHSADAETEPMTETKTKTKTKTKTNTKTPVAGSHSENSPGVSLAGAGDVRAVLPASDATAASADDFLSALSPAATARASARLGALRDLDAELERALDDERSDEGHTMRGSAETSHAFVEASSRGFPLEASLGGSKSLWDKVQTLFGAVPAAAEPAATVGSCLCACPGAGSGRADACYDVDLAVSADADGPAACARLASSGANADVCPATGVVQRCEARADADEDADAIGSVGGSSSSKKKSSKKSSKKGGSTKPPKKQTSTLGRISDALRATPPANAARPLRSGVLGSVQTAGAYECVKTARCPSAADDTARPPEEDGDRDTQWRASFSFLVEAYECDAASFARCEWAPAARCPAGEAGGTLGAAKALSGFANPESANPTPPRREWAVRLESFAAGAAAVAFAAAAFAAAKAARNFAAGRGRRFGVSSASHSDDLECAFPGVADGLSNPSSATNDGDAPRKRFGLTRRGFGVDPDALTRGVWRALGGLEATAAESGEREPLLGLGPDVDVSIDPEDPAASERLSESRPRDADANVAYVSEPKTEKTKTETVGGSAETTLRGARRKVVFDVDEALAAAPEAEGDREARAAAAAERAAKAARAARLARAKAAREEAERRLATRTNDVRVAKHAKKREEDTKNTQTPVGELSREALLERARGALPRRANAAGDTGIPGGEV